MLQLLLTAVRSRARPRTQRLARAAIVAIVSLPLVPTGSLLAQTAPDSSWREHRSAALVAYRARNFQTYRDQLAKMGALVGGHPSVVYNLASADARLGRRDSALAGLATFADMGLTQDVAADSDFASLRGDSAFVAVAQRIAANTTAVS